MPRILIIEDEPDTQDLLADVLSLEGYEVGSTGDATEGLSLVRQRRPDLIILDLRLPGIGGLDLLRLIASVPDSQPVRVLLCTGATDVVKDRADEISRLGARVLEKPFELDDLLEAVRHTLQTSTELQSQA
ncbi:MAG: response regulator [Chloroflexi bacterium]|nr:response regulator [Chloroflexota bacterium]